MPKQGILNYCRLYILKICALWHAIFSRKIKRIDFLVKLFWYLVIRNIQLGHQLYIHCTRLWPTKWYKII